MKNLYKALAAFQQEVPNIYKNASGYGYKFADLGEINEIIKPFLQKHGLGYVQPINGSKITTIVFHVESGEFIESEADIPQGVQLKGMNDFQVLGSAITYLRRYSLSSMFGLITDEDADAAGDQVKPRMTDVPKERNTGIAQPLNQPDELTRAKAAINDELVNQGYMQADTKRAFISKVLEKETIDTIDDANLIMDALEDNA